MNEAKDIGVHPCSSAVTAGVLGKARAVAGDIKVAHTVFALPFAVLAMMLAAAWAQRFPSVVEGVLIVVCMVTARTFAMAVNRAADAWFDARNPRTAGRAIPSGRVSPGEMTAVVVACGALFVLATAGFGVFSSGAGEPGKTSGGWWPLWLSPAVLGLLAFYSFTKRFTVLCHVVLGAALAASPVAAAVAIEPGFVGVATPWLLAGFVLCWVAGFDVIYALQDVAADRELGLHSLPARLGEGGALWVSRGLHAASAGFLWATWHSSEALGAGFAAAGVAAVALLVLEHALVWNSKTNRLDMAFFTVNGVISVLLGAAGVVDVVRWLKI